MSYLQPNGTDDTGQLVDAIKARARGGRLVLDEGEFIVSEIIDWAYPGLHIHGMGGLQPRLDASLPLPATRINWAGDSGEAVQGVFRCVNLPGCGLHDLHVDCKSKAFRALLVYGCRAFTCIDMSACNPFASMNADGSVNAPLSGPFITIEASPTNNSDWPYFQRVHLFNGWNGGLVLDGNVIDGVEHNVCHGTFDRVNIQETGGIAVYWGRSDSNVFYGLMTPGVADIGLLNTDPVLARSNTLYSPQLGGKCSFKINAARLPFKGLPTKVYDYNQENGEQLPVTDDPKVSYAGFVKIW